MRVRLFGAFTKTEKQDDGTLRVSGIASSEAVDSAGDVVTAAAMKAALPDYMRFGAVREMHGPIAAGTALSANVQDDGKTAFEALVVDPVSVKKIETGVLKGFSIGGRIPQGGRNAEKSNQIDKLTLTEISLVDRPANPDAVISLVKFDTAADAAEGAPHMDEKAIAKAVSDAVAAAMAPFVETITKAMAAKPAEEPKAAAAVVEPTKPKITIDETAEKLEKFASENGELKKRAEAAEKKAADLEAASKAKGVLKAVAVEKAADVAGAAKPTEEPKTAFDAIRQVHKSGGTPYIAAISRA